MGRVRVAYSYDSYCYGGLRPMRANTVVLGSHDPATFCSTRVLLQSTHATPTGQDRKEALVADGVFNLLQISKLR